MITSRPQMSECHSLNIIYSSKSDLMPLSLVLPTSLPLREVGGSKTNWVYMSALNYQIRESV